ncbi:hypothetical protein EDB80DRAFT_675948 [Ilyonectria destructans]|nr:hypothetical protein EDB80DRAFT_675948 [Ilyonectria destructans]
MYHHSILNTRPIGVAMPSSDDTANSYARHDQDDNHAGDNDSPFFEHVQPSQPQDAEPHAEPPNSDGQDQRGPSTRWPSLEESLKHVWATNTLIRLTLKATLAALCLCSLVAPILPRSEHGLVPPGVYVYYEPLALYDDAMAMAETYATAVYPLTQDRDIDLLDLGRDATALCLELYSRADMWTPDGGPVVTKNKTALLHRMLADFDDDIGFDTFEQGDVDVYALCTYIYRTVSVSESLYDEGFALSQWLSDSVTFLWFLGHILARGIAENKASGVDSKAWPWSSSTMVRQTFESLWVKSKEPSLVWPADGNQLRAVEIMHRLLTSSINFTAGKFSNKTRAGLSSLKTKLLAADKALGKLGRIAEDVVVRSVATAPIPSGLLRRVSRDEAKIKRISQAALRVREARVNLTGLVAKLDAVTAMGDSVLGCEAAWAQLTGELMSASDMPRGVTLPGSRYLWTGSGWMTKRSRGERRPPNVSKSIGICADLKERLRNLPGRHDEVDDVDAYDHYDQDMADAVVLFMPDPTMVLLLVGQSWGNCSLLRVKRWEGTEDEV